MNRRFTLLLAAFAAFAAIPALAAEFKAGDLVIDQPWSRATSGGAVVAAGFLVIHNNGGAPDKLVGGTADFAGAVELHQMSMDNGVMKMRKIEAGLDIPAHATVTLDPMGFHIMFAGLKRQLVQGEAAKADLMFEHAGTVPVTFTVGPVGAMGPGGG
jgi:periplasmic copper chaperone A